MSSVKCENGVFQIRRRNEILGDDIELSLRLEFRNATLEEKLTEHEAKKLTRMEALRERVGALLATPLMQIVSKEPVISSNITKTNVLTMNENFSNSLELYEYLLNYDKKCYHVNKVTEVVPISSSLAFPMLGLELLVSLLKESKTDDYEIKKNEIIADEKKKAIDELSKRIDKIKEKYQADPSSYVAILEDKINLLESENMQMQVLRDNLDKIVLVKEGLDKDNKALRMDIDNLLSKLRDLEARLKDVNASEDLIRTEYEDKLKEKNKEIEELKEALEKKTNALQEALIQKQNAISKTDKLKEDLSNERKKYDELKRTSDLEIESKDKEINERLDFKRLNEVRFKGIQAMAGEINSENAETSKEAFDELEDEYNAFTSYYEEVWKKTKKEIIKEIKRKKG
jgi:DNA repair exonuclease SbcCD ATPase subunit